ncbi:MAG: ShlB/FhaC/HecB family hemolysin secretion/activation protein [Alphaproteobacteria bacterium]|nr:ShlB/FhaC/HecB family hemolysin secretion/activation protein [Alphaproteobacteria bacterium]
MTKRILSSCAFFFLCLAGSAQAQVLAPSADPGRVDQPILPKDVFSGLQSQALPQSAKPALPPETANLTFVLNSLTIQGAQAFSPDRLGDFYRPYLGKTITLGQLFDIMARIQQLYLDEGYTISKVLIPEQAIDSGNIVFTVVEGYVESVELDPSFPKSPILEDFAAKVLAMRPLNTKKLERFMLILNDKAGLRASSVLSKIENHEDDPGGLKLTLRQNQDELGTGATYVSFDTFGSNFTGFGQFGAGTSFNHLGTNYSELLLNGVVTTSSQEMRQASVEYNLPLWGVSGTNLRLSSEMNRTEPGSSLDILDVKGRSFSMSAQLSYPIIRQRDQTWLLSTSFEYKNVGTDILGEPLFQDRIRSVGVMSRYTFSDRYDGLNLLQADFSRGLNVLAARETGEPNLSRQFGQSDFWKAELLCTRLQTIARNFEALWSVKGQYAWQPLLSSEEFGFGGGYLGRGYDPSEITGDRGISTSLELRYNKALPEWNMALQPYAFYDIGRVWNIDPLDRNRKSAASAGAGMRMNFAKGWAVDGSFAVPLTRAADNPPKYGSEYGPRYLFSVKKTF